MTSYTDKHLAKAKDVLPRLFSDENVVTTHDGEAAYVGDRCLAVIAEALADAERDAFKRAAEIAGERVKKSLEEIDAVGSDAYWQGSASSAEIVRNAILSEAGEGR